MDRVFLDANVLFSAAYRPDTGLTQLWQIKGIKLITSAYALHEARISLDTESQRQRLDELMQKVELMESLQAVTLPMNITLPDKDRPILQAALSAKSSHLLTGDIRNFGEWLGKKINNMNVMLPGGYIRFKKRNNKNN